MTRENNIENQFTNQPGNQVIYAGFWIRLWAYIIDNILISFLTILIIIIFIAFLAFLPIGDDSNLTMRSGNFFSYIEANNFSYDDIVSIAILITVIAYSVYFLTSKKQATPGKRVCNIYVGTKNGQKLSVARIVARVILSHFSILLCGIGVLIIAFTKEKTALHDIICGTRVFVGQAENKN